MTMTALPAVAESADAWLHDRPARRFRVGDKALTVRVRESRRARTARIILGPSRPLEIIVPAGFSDVEIDGLLEEKRRWIAKKVEQSRAIAERPHQLGLDRAGVVWLHGAPVTVRRITATRASARLHNGTLLVSGPDDRSSDTVLRWYRREAGRRITAAAARDAIALGVEFHSLAIRDQRTRWGSCSRRGNLSFSWRLVAAPRSVLDYVVVHELCHLREPNHSKAFYRLLDTVRPMWRDDARWLSAHGAELQAYGSEW